jgi:plastocyanin
MRIPIVLGIALVVGASFGCGSSSNPGAPTPPITGGGGSGGGSGTAVSIVQGSSTRTTNAYSPNPINVAVGATVTWTNNDTVAHTSTSDTGLWSSGSIAPQGTFSRMFSSAGSFTYHCAIHPGMVGTVTVQ